MQNGGAVSDADTHSVCCRQNYLSDGMWRSIGALAIGKMNFAPKTVRILKALNSVEIDENLSLALTVLWTYNTFLFK